MAVNFIDGGNPGKTTNLSQVTDKLYHIISANDRWFATPYIVNNITSIMFKVFICSISDTVKPAHAVNSIK